MHILTEGGGLANMDLIVNTRVDLEEWNNDISEGERHTVVAYEPGRTQDDKDYNVYPIAHPLCTCDSEEHGKQIILCLAESLGRGDTVVYMERVLEQFRQARGGAE